jgi:prepilin-type processing-associated H-X9-DG protein
VHDLLSPNTYKRVAPAELTGLSNSASRMHPGGLNALFGDGSVHFIKENVNTWPLDPSTGKPVGTRQTQGGSWVNLPRAGVWQTISTRSGGETVGEDQY